jgi:hypothetical protein
MAMTLRTGDFLVNDKRQPKDRQLQLAFRILREIPQRGSRVPGVSRSMVAGLRRVGQPMVARRACACWLDRDEIVAGNGLLSNVLWTCAARGAPQAAAPVWEERH